jgi:hypothetical protein
MDIDTEFDRQVRAMLDADYPARTGHSTAELMAVVEPLRSKAHEVSVASSVRTPEHLPWAIVLTEQVVSVERLVAALRLPGGTRPGVVDRNYGEESPADYEPLPNLDVPSAPAYLLVDVDRGDEFRGVRPRDAVPTIAARGRTPLTIAEGVAFALLNPESLERNHCYMLAGSRRSHKRVPALWIADRAPKLGWCWEGNHHTWLGVASAGARLASDG